MLWQLRGALLGMGGLQVGATALVARARRVRARSRRAAARSRSALILSLSSTAIVLQSLSEKGLLKTEAGERSFAVLLFQDIAVIPMLSLLPLLASGAPIRRRGGHAQGDGWVATLPAWGKALVDARRGRGDRRSPGASWCGPLFRFIARTRRHARCSPRRRCCRRRRSRC